MSSDQLCFNYYSNTLTLLSSSFTPASGYLLVTFDDYGLLVGILLALMMVLPALYHYYYKCDKYSLVMRNARKAAKVEVTNSFESHEMDNLKPLSRSRLITIESDEEEQG